MKTKKEIKEKEFDSVTTFRKIKEKISNDLTGKSFEEIKEYLSVNSLKLKLSSKATDCVWQDC